MTQIDYRTAPGQLPFNSQRGGLIAFGVIFIVIGIVAFLGALSLPLARIFAPGQMPWRVIIPLGITYACISGFCVYLGIDNIRARRWVRPFGIVFGGLGLLAGAFAVVFLILQYGGISQAMQPAAGQGAPPQAAMVVGLVIAILVSIMFYLVLPGLMFWFYRRQEVLLTVQYFDPHRSWTDDVPLSLLAIAAVEVSLAIGGLFVLMYGFFPFFTLLIQGPLAILLCGALTILHLIATLCLVRRNIAGWWIALLLPIIQFSSQNVALHYFGSKRFFEAMQMDVAIQNQAAYSTMSNPTITSVTWGVMLMVWIAFLFQARPALKPSAPAGDAQAS